MKIELAFLDAVFHVTARAVNFSAEILRLALASLQRGNDEARLGFAGGELNSALPTTRRSRLQLSSVVHRKSLQ